MAWTESETKILILTILLFIATILVFFRLYVRIYCRGPLTVMRTYRWSEALIVFAWLNYIYQTAELCYFEIHGWTGDPDYQEWVQLVDFWASVLYQTIPQATKAALLLYYMELSPRDANRKIWNAILFTWLLLAADFGTTVGMKMFGCLPFSNNWSRNNGFGRPCKIKNNYFIVTYVFHELTEIFIFVIPFFILRQIKHIPRTKIVAAIAMFSLGFINIAALTLLWAGTLQTQFSKDHRLKIEGAWDYTWLVQPFTAVTVACIPYLRRTWVDFNEWRLRRRDGTKKLPLFKTGVFSTIRRQDGDGISTDASTAVTGTTLATVHEDLESAQPPEKTRDLEVGVQIVKSNASSAP